MVDENAALARVGGVPLWILKSDVRFPVFAREEATAPELVPLDIVFKHHWAHGLDFTFLDVGAHYGWGAIIVTNFFRKNDRHNQIIAFEPGATAALIGRNLSLNHVDGDVTFEFLAVSDRSGKAIIYSEPAYPPVEAVLAP
jgi:hypothetical protein